MLGNRLQTIAGTTGSTSWYLAQSNQGQQLLAEGRIQEASVVFREILNQFGDEPSYKKAVTLGNLGRCYEAGGRSALAERLYRDQLAVIGQLEPAREVEHSQGIALTNLADVLTDQGRYAEARESYQKGLEVKRGAGDLLGQATSLGQLGFLALQEGNLEEAAERYRDALILFHQIQAPTQEAIAWHQLGVTFQTAKQWVEAERHYRESARIKEQLGDIAGSARTWIQLATVNRLAGKLAAAETWYRKATEGSRQMGDLLTASNALNNLADFLRFQPARLAEARQMAEEALSLKRTLDPGASGIWSTYQILAYIADREGQLAQAREYRRLAREAKRNFAGTRHELRRHAPLIFATIGAVQESSHRASLEQDLPTMEQNGWTNLVAAIRRILSGERDADALCESLDHEDSMIVEAILAGLEEPSTLQDLLPAAE